MNNEDRNNILERGAGILLHPTSLYNPFGIGDFGSSTYNFIRFLKRCGIKYWQILPLGPTGYADSPYQCISAFAGNPLFISPDLLIKMGLISKDEVYKSLTNIYKDQLVKSNKADFRWTVPKIIDFQKVRAFKYEILKISFKKFKENKDFNNLFMKFCKDQSYWLDEYVLFYSLKNEFNYKSWVDWPEKYSQRDNKAIELWKKKHEKEFQFYKFIQWIFEKQWFELKEFSNIKGIQIIGDMPIFVAHDSADVWSNPDLFTLNHDGSLIYQAGVPPDYFSKTGQLWGNPLYIWKKMENNDFKWFISRFKRLMNLFNWIRVDHFRGFQAYWRVNGEAKTAIKGKWMNSPGKKLFLKIEEKLGNLNIIAENLGVITPEVEELRNYFNFPGMKVLQFAFGNDSSNVHLPHNYKVSSIVYTGTHDNDTTLGWWQNGTTEKEKKKVLEYLDTDGTNIVSDMIKAIFRTVSKVTIIPLQDLLGQGSKCRMNTPSVEGGNWLYRLSSSDLSNYKSDWIHNTIDIYGRLPK